MKCCYPLKNATSVFVLITHCHFLQQATNQTGHKTYEDFLASAQGGCAETELRVGCDLRLHHFHFSAVLLHSPTVCFESYKVAADSAMSPQSRWEGLDFHVG